jgi:hypothetical protein
MSGNERVLPGDRDLALRATLPVVTTARDSSHDPGRRRVATRSARVIGPLLVICQQNERTAQNTALC